MSLPFAQFFNFDDNTIALPTTNSFPSQHPFHSYRNNYFSPGGAQSGANPSLTSSSSPSSPLSSFVSSPFGSSSAKTLKTSNLKSLRNHNETSQPAAASSPLAMINNNSNRVSGDLRQHSDKQADGIPSLSLSHISPQVPSRSSASNLTHLKEKEKEKGAAISESSISSNPEKMIFNNNNSTSSKMDENPLSVIELNPNNNNIRVYNSTAVTSPSSSLKMESNSNLLNSNNPNQTALTITTTAVQSSSTAFNSINKKTSSDSNPDQALPSYFLNHENSNQIITAPFFFNHDNSIQRGDAKDNNINQRKTSVNNNKIKRTLSDGSSNNNDNHKNNSNVDNKATEHVMKRAPSYSSSSGLKSCLGSLNNNNTGNSNNNNNNSNDNAIKRMPSDSNNNSNGSNDNSITTRTLSNSSSASNYVPLKPPDENLSLNTNVTTTIEDESLISSTSCPELITTRTASTDYNNSNSNSSNNDNSNDSNSINNDINSSNSTNNQVPPSPPSSKIGIISSSPPPPPSPVTSASPVSDPFGLMEGKTIETGGSLPLEAHFPTQPLVFLPFCEESAAITSRLNSEPIPGEEYPQQLQQFSSSDEDETEGDYFARYQRANGDHLNFLKVISIIDDEEQLFNGWRGLMKTKGMLVNGNRFENASWRRWFQKRFNIQKQELLPDNSIKNLLNPPETSSSISEPIKTLENPENFPESIQPLKTLEIQQQISDMDNKISEKIPEEVIEEKIYSDFETVKREWQKEKERIANEGLLSRRKKVKNTNNNNYIYKRPKHVHFNEEMNKTAFVSYEGGSTDRWLGDKEEMLLNVDELSRLRHQHLHPIHSSADLNNLLELKKPLLLERLLDDDYDHLRYYHNNNENNNKKEKNNKNNELRKKEKQKLKEKQKEINYDYDNVGTSSTSSKPSFSHSNSTLSNSSSSSSSSSGSSNFNPSPLFTPIYPLHFKPPIINKNNNIQNKKNNNYNYTEDYNNYLKEYEESWEFLRSEWLTLVSPIKTTLFSLIHFKNPFRIIYNNSNNSSQNNSELSLEDLTKSRGIITGCVDMLTELYLFIEWCMGLMFLNIADLFF